MTLKPDMRIAVYDRLAVQNPARRLERDLEARRYCLHRFGVEPISFFADDGISGLAPSRDGLDDLLDATACDEFDVVLIPDFARLSPNPVLMLRLLRLLEDHAVVRPMSSKSDASAAREIRDAKIKATWSMAERIVALALGTDDRRKPPTDAT